MGIHTVLKQSFSPQKSIVLEIHSVFLRPLEFFASKNLHFKTAMHAKARDFFCKTR